tara:strand:- start:187945 stop:189540 length:1596 start_codon:yes stop_codon:yes gene_type:complete
MTKNKIYFPLLLSIAVVLGILIGSQLNYPRHKNVLLFNKNPQEEKIKRLIDYIQYDYVDQVNTDSLLDGTIKQIISKLDPHSVYIPASEATDIAERMNGEFVGIGVQFRVYKDTIAVVKVLENGPSRKAGIKAGDRILIAGKDTLFGKKLGNDFIMKTLKGKPKTTVNLTIYRKSENKTYTVLLKRGTVPIKSIDAYYMMNDSLGYIKVDRFAATTYDEFKVALDSLKRKNMEHLVLDLRGNPGGYLGVATKMVDEFLEDDKLIVFTKNKGGKIEKSFASAKGDFEKGKVYVLIDENSASASEIVAGALQDNDKGTIVGRRSFGKGLVQQEMGLGDGSAVRLTVSRYYTPTGRSIQKPYHKNDSQAYFEGDGFEERLYSGELLSADSIKVNDSLKYITPKGKTVYGGGGIIPDVFVGIDTTGYLETFHFRVMNNFVFDYVDNNRKELEKWTLPEFVKDFDKDDKILNEYLAIIKPDLKGEIDNIPYIKRYLSSLFAQFLFGDNEFYQVLNQNDKMLEKVKELEYKVDYVKH